MVLNRRCSCEAREIAKHVSVFRLSFEDLNNHGPTKCLVQLERVTVLLYLKHLPFSVLMAT